MSPVLLACAKYEAKKQVKRREFLKKSIFKENVVALKNNVLHFCKFDTLKMKQFSKFGLLRS